MMVFYQCFGRAHTSIVAAHLHLGTLPMAGPPRIAQLMALPFFDRAKKEDLGKPLYFGTDDGGHRIYAIGLGATPRTGLGVIHGIMRCAQRDDELLVVNTLRGLSIMGRIGGGLSRELGLVAIGRPMVAYGVKLVFPTLVQTVVSVKRILKEVAR